MLTKQFIYGATWLLQSWAPLHLLTQGMSYPERKLLDVQRTLGLRGVSYICPLCSQDYTQEPVLWRHLRDRHEAHLGLTESGEGEAKIRKLWKEKAKQKAYVGNHYSYTSAVTGSTRLYHLVADFETPQTRKASVPKLYCG